MSIRTLAHKNGLSLAGIYKRLTKELLSLPHNNQVTMQYCNKNKFCGVLLVDGKYVKVKDYKKKIPFIYGIDYETHDIPICVLRPSENHIALKDFFMKVRNTGYKLRGIVCDDNEATKGALKLVYQKALVQLCHTHFLENIRRELKTRTEELHRPFVDELKKILFNPKKVTKKKIKKRLWDLYGSCRKNSAEVAVLVNIENNIDELTNHLKIGGCPKTNNLIESYNKQLNGRLKTINGFQSFQSAERWLSAWILRRRVTPFTDCRKKFKKLNGFHSLSKTKKGNIQLPDFF